jgi:molybdenum cofactor cytidylyltransferase
MKFGPASPADAIGGVTVHTLRQGPLVLKKGTTIGPAEVEALDKAGVKEVVVVRLEDGDVSEDVAAASIAKAVAGDGVHVERAFTGRSNLFAARAGVLVVDRAAVDRINGVDEAITFATLAAFKPVVEGEMIATVKLIPFGVEAKLRDAAVAQAGRDALRIAPYTIKKVGVVSTLLPGLAPKVIEKTLRVTAERLAPAGAAIIAERRVPHDETALADSIKELHGLGAELVIVFGASAIADRRDVIPAAITEIGGAIEHFGMPVDPGNLLLIGSAGGVPVLGAPGCARSPVENGFDWVLMRLLAGLKVSRSDLTGMGVGGLLMEIVTRPQPRTVPDLEGNRNVAAIVLAAGRSTRMGGPNKLLAELDGKKLVRIATEQALASKASEVIVVTGHQADLVEQALSGLKVKFVRNPDFAGGLASSVKSGIAAVPANADGAVICLGDMPLIDAKLIDRLIEAFEPDRGHLIAVPVSDGRRGNPVLWSRRFFPELMTLDGDVGARHLIAKHAEAVAEVPVEGFDAFLDIDTPQALEAARRSYFVVRRVSHEIYPRRPGERRANAGTTKSTDRLSLTHPDFNLPFTKSQLPPARFGAACLGGWDLDRFDCHSATSRVVHSCADPGRGRVAFHHADLGRRRARGRQMRRLWPGL